MSETYATKSAVDSIQIGGRNLLYDSTGNLKNGWSGNTIITVDGGTSGNSLAISRTGYSGTARYFGTSKRHFLTDFNVGTSYTLSAWIKVRSDVELDASGYVMARFRSADNKKLYALSLTVSSQTEKDKWIYYEKTWTINDSDIAKLECVALALDKNGMIEACNIKLEKGTKATDWSPAPEDTAAEITSLSSKQSSLEQTVNGFKATVESTYATNDSVTQKVSAVEQKADKISWLVKSGTSVSSMELTSKALEIIANTEIKGDVIVGVVIKSTNYSEFVGFDNFVAIFDMSSGNNILALTWNTLIMWVLGFVPQIIISLLFAYWFTNVRLRLRCLGFFKTVMYMPNLIMASAFAMLIFSIFSDIGPINELIKHTTGGEAFRFLSYTGSTMGLVAFMNFIMWFGNTTILLMAGIMGIDQSLFEAANIDGASSLQVFFKVTLPLLMPILVYTVITALIGGLQMFDVPQVLTNALGTPNRTSTTLVMYLNNYLKTSKNYGMSGAISVVIFIITGLLSLVVFKSLTKQEEN